MKHILKNKWFNMALWIVLAGCSIISMPNMDNLLREKGQVSIPEQFPSYRADELLKEFNHSKEEKDMAVLIVFHEDTALGSQQMKEIERGIQKLEAGKDKLGITNILAHTKSEEVRKQLVSKDGTTVLTSVSVHRGDRTRQQVSDELSTVLKDIPVAHSLTGPELITEDFIKTTQSGVKKTEGVAVVFIIIVLVAIFRSAVAPVASLLTVGLTYIVSLGVVTQLVDKLDFPFSNFTQIFLVLILFGIGTDYIILLFTRFKEELGKQETKRDAILHTYKTAGKTVLYSGIAVFIGFSALGLAQFKLFKSASAVGIGVAVLMLALFTVIPALMMLLGGKLFWPSKKIAGHGENKLTSSITRFAVRRPIIGLIIALLLTIPALVLYKEQLTYNSVKEISDSYSTVKGINLVYEHFPPGQALPAALVLKDDQSLDSQNALKFIDQVTEMIGKTSGVEKVYSATRPNGEKIPELYTDDQNASLKEGIGKANDGIQTIQNGLSEAEDKLGEVPEKSFSEVDRLITATMDIQGGLDQAVQALNQIDKGMQQGVQGAEDLHSGLVSLNQNLSKLTSATDNLSEGLSGIHAGYDQIAEQYQTIETSLQGLVQVSNKMNGYISALEQSISGIGQNSDFAALKQSSLALSEQLNKLSAGMSQLNGTFEGANQKLAELDQGMKQIQAGQQQLIAGAGQLESGALKLEDGISRASSGQQQTIARLPEMSNGLEQINQGQQQLDQGLSKLGGQMTELEKGLGESADGLEEISGGLASAQSYLNEVTGTGSADSFFIPEEVRTGEEFSAALDQYLSANRHLAKWTIVLSVDPYSNEAMEIIDSIHDQYKEMVKGGSFADSPYGITGTSAQNNDLNEMSTGDFTKTAVIMLTGILIVLMVITRSFRLPVVIIASLVLAYYTALAATRLIFATFTSNQELTWTTPFFSFIMIVALGVDYSIFLMMRYREYDHLRPGQAITEAMKHTGSIIVSAVIILCGTFAAMYPSGLLTLTQLSTAVITALVLLVLVMLPLFLPALIALGDRSKPEAAAEQDFDQ
ncbi:MMPL family transporter [Paenibacillus caui]|uniref:MMPL family transporter n=1 Tax=Paenibacillus caui TaxID=2873927 RepID=UPI001CA996BE|nr:MMPL family transporter [Paenibacillus caui]